MPAAMTATCQHGPYQLSGVSIAPKATLKLTIASCTGKRVQTTIVGVTALVHDLQNINVRSFVNGKVTDIFSADKVGCFQKPTGIRSEPSDYSGTAQLELTCNHKKKACTVDLAWAADCTVIEDGEDE